MDVLCFANDVYLNQWYNHSLLLCLICMYAYIFLFLLIVVPKIVFIYRVLNLCAFYYGKSHDFLLYLIIHASGHNVENILKL